MLDKIPNSKFECYEIAIPSAQQPVNYIPNDINVILQSENGLLGMGPYPEKNKVKSQNIKQINRPNGNNAAKTPTIVPAPFPPLNS